MWERVAEILQRNGRLVRLGADVVTLSWRDNKVEAVDIEVEGKRERIRGTHFISSMPIRELFQKLEPAAPPEVLEAANALNYRDFLIVALIIKKIVAVKTARPDKTPTATPRAI